MAPSTSLELLLDFLHDLFLQIKFLDKVIFPSVNLDQILDVDALPHELFVFLLCELIQQKLDFAVDALYGLVLLAVIFVRKLFAFVVDLPAERGALIQKLDHLILLVR